MLWRTATSLPGYVSSVSGSFSCGGKKMESILGTCCVLTSPGVCRSVQAVEGSSLCPCFCKKFSSLSTELCSDVILPGPIELFVLPGHIPNSSLLRVRGQGFIMAGKRPPTWLPLTSLHYLRANLAPYPDTHPRVQSLRSISDELYQHLQEVTALHVVAHAPGQMEMWPVPPSMQICLLCLPLFSELILRNV